MSGTGTLAGSGGTTGAVIMNSGGTLAPGTSTAVGTLNTGPLSLNGTATFKLEINTGVHTASRENVAGNLFLDASNSVVLSLADLGTSTTLPLGTVFPLIDYTGTWNGGTFASLPNGSTFSFGVNQYQIQYNAVDTSHGGVSAVTLTALAVPEPGNIALLGLGGLLLAARRRRARTGR